MPTVAFLSLHRHPRLRFILRELGRDLGYQFRLFTNRERWEKADSDARITYGLATTKRDALQLPAHPFTGGKHPNEQDLKVSWHEDVPMFFNVEGQYDLLACTFFCLSRYEEYQAFRPDQHDRFPASISHAKHNGYLKLPVVRIYAQTIARKLRQVFPELPLPKAHPYLLQPSYDIDMLWAYQHRGWKGVASGIRDVVTGQSLRARERFLGDKAKDPFFTLDYLLQLHPTVKPYFFWLLADNQQREDTNPYPVPQEQREVMRALKNSAVHGIHPGYNSALGPEKVREETERYQGIFGLYPAHSRQHFLRLRFPKTYRALQLAGITNDHSMGYSDSVGWRAGTNLPFTWYDVERETMTGLTVHPFAAMDVTLKDYLGLSPEEAIETLDELQQNIRRFGGPYTLLWHNSSFSDAFGWAGWQEVYEQLW